MYTHRIFTLVLAACVGLAITRSRAYADGDLHNVKHIIVVMQENHSFDNYLGTLPYVSGTPYHEGPCKANDHSCVDGLNCSVEGSGNITCTNSNLDDDGSTVSSFHEGKYCTGPDLDHSWMGSHLEGNYTFPNLMRQSSPNDGFVRQNDATEQLDGGVESATEDDTMGFYTQTDLPFYYALAENFAIDDSYHCSVVGPTFPNRAYALAATSFGHVTTAEIFPPAGGYKPITGTIFDLLDGSNVPWVNVFSDLPTSAIFRNPPTNVLPVSFFMTLLANNALPPVSFVDPSFFPDQTINGGTFETDEHPPNDVRAGEYFVSQIVQAVRNSSAWKDSIIFITYDEHGGFYDHVAPPRAQQGGFSTPDGIDPGLCADLSNPPMSLMPGFGAQCAVSNAEAQALCPLFSGAPPYPGFCANFNQLGFRVPFIAVSPFSKPHYVSHTVGDHTSILALIEKRFLGLDGDARKHLTKRDLHAATLEDMFDFDHSPSLSATIPTAPLPGSSDSGCTFVPAS